MHGKIVEFSQCLDREMNSMAEMQLEAERIFSDNDRSLQQIRFDPGVIHGCI